MTLSLYAIAGTAILALILGAFGYGDLRGHMSAQEACEAQSAATLAASLSKWQETRQAQDLRDSAAHAADAERQKAAADQLTSIAERFDKVKLSIVKVQPPAKCELSPLWLSIFNGETP